ncbi:hypothetical protein IscW_ISCW020456 [Ixodes scapularis]|uniref:Uncharacterized protein n=1 Tax=Ixodes scapularis TaxID=6945 RepID=B7Q1C7_IXOSC|nr:hypothetical protein IscW_ISCW020456 [Ixodes scapularis]|eukprot:XP_002409335.1 hypothetical protein IscW_ISCW020456 [Ixodes scapularis]
MVELLKHIKSSFTLVIKIRSVQSCLIDMDPVNMVTPLYREKFLGLTWVNTCIFVSLWTTRIMYAFLGNSGVYINEKLVYEEISEILYGNAGVVVCCIFCLCLLLCPQAVTLCRRLDPHLRKILNKHPLKLCR